MKLHCPICSTMLVQIPLHNRVSHVCLKQHGRAVATMAARNWMTKDSRPRFDAAVESAKPGNRNCPRCRQKMKRLLYADGPELDQCISCELTWFDKGEQEAIPQRSEKEINTSVLDKFDVTISGRIVYRSGLSPYEGVEGERWKLPIFTLFIILVCTVITHLARRGGFHGFVFDARHPLAGFGVPAVLSIFAHANMGHLINNTAFFFIPGTVMESTFGPKHLLQIFLFSGFGGLVLHGALMPNSLLIGASGAMAGVFTALALTQPNASYVRHHYGASFRAGFYTMITRVPIWFVFCLWLSSQLFGSMKQVNGGAGGVSYLAHLGGALAAVVYVFLSDMKLLAPELKARASAGSSAA